MAGTATPVIQKHNFWRASRQGETFPHCSPIGAMQICDSFISSKNPSSQDCPRLSGNGVRMPDSVPNTHFQPDTPGNACLMPSPGIPLPPPSPTLTPASAKLCFPLLQLVLVLVRARNCTGLVDSQVSPNMPYGTLEQYWAWGVGLCLNCCF